MHALKPLLKHWLKLQCQMIHDCSLGLLVQHVEAKSPAVQALWPDTAATDNIAVNTARNVISKQRIQLSKQGNGEVYLGFPVKIKGEFWGAIVVQLSRHDSSTMRAVVKLLDWGLVWLQFILYEYDTYIEGALTQNKVASSLNTPESNNNPAQTLNLLNSALKENSIEETSISIVNFLASHFNLDRVSLGLVNGKHLELAAVSFAANFDPRTLPMQTIQDAMQEAITQRQDIHVLHSSASPSTTLEDLNQHAPPLGNTLKANEQPAPAQLHHQRLLDSHQLKTCHSFVLRTEGQIVGALTVENAKTLSLNEDTQKFIEKCEKSLATIIQLKRDSVSSLRATLKRKALNGAARVFGAKHPLETLFFTCAAIFFVALFIPSNFYVSNTAAIESTNKHLLVSPYDGFLGAIYAEPGDIVEQYQILAKLKDDELNLERRKLSSQLQQYRLEYDNALANGNRAQAAILNAQVEQSTIELRLIEQKLKRVQLASPISGIIVSDDISQTVGAPVKQGDVLFEIADSAEYRVSLFVDERNVNFLQEKQKGTLKLKSLPSESIDIEVFRITPLSEVRNGRNFFRVDAELISPPSTLRPGMSGSAKIYINRKTLGWIWFHDLWYWLRLSLWV